MKRCRFCAEEIQDAAVVCKHCGRTLTADNPEAVFRGAELAMGFGAFCLVGALLYAGLEGAQPEPPVKAVRPPPPLEISVLDNPALRLPPGEHFDTAFVVTDPRPCTFHAHVQGLDGGRRDVEVYLLDEDGHVNWHNRREPISLYESGRTSATTVEVPLREGRYHLLISNRFSVFTAKTVQIDNARVVCK
ncbi:MAG TPA: hypothetical protein VF705_03495 [Longimicrobium sp.]|jgi:hypothetical protein